LMPGAMRLYSLQVRQQLIWWFCLEICKQRSMAPSFVAARRLCDLRRHFIKAATQSLHTREDQCVWVETQPACRQPRKKDGLADCCPWRHSGMNSLMWASTKWNWDSWAKFRSHSHVPGSAYTTTEWDIRTRSGPPRICRYVLEQPI
jgi:hypothetical protein